MLAPRRRCFASASVSPRERRTHTVFCSVVPWFVKGLRCSSLAVVMALHEPLTMALHGSPASLSDELFARPRADPRVLFPHASSRAARGCMWFGCTQHHSLPSPPRAARVEGVVFRLVVNSAMPCLWPLSRVAGNTSLLEPVPRRSVSQPANCTSRQALLCLVSRDRPQWSFLPLPALCRRWFGFHRFGLRGRLPPKLSRCDSSQLSPLRLAVCLVVSGHSSTQTCSN